VVAVAKDTDSVKHFRRYGGCLDVVVVVESSVLSRNLAASVDARPLFGHCTR
jgi:hypothetical protein